MSSLTFYFLACLMFVTIVSSHKILIPAEVNHPDRQCQLRNYRGACSYLEPQATLVICNNMECAGTRRANALNYRAMCIGQAADGTHCGRKKVCYNGDCIDLPGNMRMPRQLHENDEGFLCYRTNVASSGYSS